MAEYQHGLFGCFDDCGLCVLTFFVPCFTNGKNAEAVGQNCLLCGFGFWPLPLCLGIYIRGLVRERRGIPGTCCTDCLSFFFCPLCTLMQDAQEVKEMRRPAMASERMIRE